MEIREALKIMKDWVEYEKDNKDKIKSADTLIEIQETILDYIEELEDENYIQKVALYENEPIDNEDREENEKLKEWVDKLAEFLFYDYYNMTYENESQFNKRKREIVRRICIGGGYND